MSFTIFQNEKTRFQGIKTRISKYRKNVIFRKWLTHGFGLKMAIFSKGVNQWFSSENGHFSNFLFLGNIVQENVFYEILERKNPFLGYKNTKFKKSKNWNFSKGVNQWFSSENGHFSNFFFLGNIVQENVFYEILERKNPFLGYKNKKFKKSKS